MLAKHDKPFLTSAEVCSILKMSTKTLQRLRNRRAISFVRLAGSYRYSQSALDLFIMQRCNISTKGRKDERQ